jgi:hypothetical protein
MQCHKCQHENASDAKFCNQCAAPFTPACSACGHENTVDAKFCNQCGTSLIVPTSASDAINAIPHEAETEARFHITLSAVMGWLQRERRMTYRTLKYLLSLDDPLLGEIRNELVLRQLAVEDQEQVLVWTGEPPPMRPLSWMMSPVFLLLPLLLRPRSQQRHPQLKPICHRMGRQHRRSPSPETSTLTSQVSR